MKIEDWEAARKRGFFVGGCNRNLLKGNNSGFTFNSEEETSNLGKRQNKLREEESGHIVNTYQQRMDGYLKELGL
ncbi:hypothetical protein ES707_12044 [subsurface metagenome]